jgi:hypothetical protein
MIRIQGAASSMANGISSTNWQTRTTEVAPAVTNEKSGRARRAHSAKNSTAS